MEPLLSVPQHPALRTRADRVLDALRTLSRNGIASHPMGTIATVAGVSNDTARRGIADLVGARLIEELPLRTGKRRTFRLLDVGSPQVDVGSPQPAALQAAGGTPEGSPVGGPPSGAPGTAAAAAQAAPGSPAAEALAQAARDEAWESRRELLSDAEWLEEREWGIRQLREILAELMGIEAELVDADVGPCHDDASHVGPRLVAGELRLCRACFSARHRARVRLESEALQAGIALGEGALPMPSRVVLPAGVRP